MCVSLISVPSFKNLGEVSRDLPSPVDSETESGDSPYSPIVAQTWSQFS